MIEIVCKTNALMSIVILIRLFKIVLIPLVLEALRSKKPVMYFPAVAIEQVQKLGHCRLPTTDCRLLVPKGELPEIDLESAQHIMDLPHFKPLGFLYLPSFP
jgi:hypothetical protein